MTHDTWTEERHGQTFTVTCLPSDPRLQPARTRKRALWNSLTPLQKTDERRRRKAAAKKRRRL